ncbi:hypothetical protein QF002_001301 [Paraburkholderia youngii]
MCGRLMPSERRGQILRVSAWQWQGRAVLAAPMAQPYSALATAVGFSPAIVASTRPLMTFTA